MIQANSMLFVFTNWQPFVAPANLSASLQATLHQIGIEVLGYEWKDEEPVFVRLEEWKF